MKAEEEQVFLQGKKKEQTKEQVSQLLIYVSSDTYVKNSIPQDQTFRILKHKQCPDLRTATSLMEGNKTSMTKKTYF